MERIVGIFLNPPMAIARVGRSPQPMDAYVWAMDENPHRGMQTRIVPAPSLHPAPLHEGEPGAATLKVVTPARITFKDDEGRVRPVAPFFEIWARVQDSRTGGVRDEPLTPELLSAGQARPRDLHFRVTAANRKAQARTKRACCAAIARVEFSGADHAPKPLLAVSPHTQGEVPLVRPDAPLPLGTVQLFAPGDTRAHPEARLDQYRLRFTPGKGDSYGPPEATEAPASPLQPGAFEPAMTENGRIHAMTRPENRFLSSDTPWLGYNFRTDNSPKWPTPMDSYDGSRVGSGNGWGLIDDTCDLVIEAELTIGGRVLSARARAFAGPPDFAPDRRPFYSIRDELEDRELPPAEVDMESTPGEILDLFRRIFETASLMNLDQRRAWALGGNAWIVGAPNPDAPDWDEGLSPRLGPRSMRAADAPYAELVPDYTPGQDDSRISSSGTSDRLPYTMVVQQVHARMADSPILREYLARRPDRVRRIVRPPYARLADLPQRVGVQKPAPVSRHAPQPGEEPVRYRDPRSTLDQTYDMRMPPYMRHSMGVPLSITRRQYDLLMAYLDRLEADPAWRAAEAGTPEEILE